MLIKPKNKESGIILVIVITFILMMSITMVGVFSRNASTSLTPIEQIKRSKAEILAKAGYWDAYSRLSSGLALANKVVWLDNITYNIDFYRTGSKIEVNVTYP